MASARGRLSVFGVTTLCVLSLAGASPLQRDRLADYEGVYAYHGGASIALVAGDALLFAVIDEAKYPLRPLGEDRFLNGSGDTILFRRGDDGAVSGFVERTVFFARRTAKVDPDLLRHQLAIAGNRPAIDADAVSTPEGPRRVDMVVATGNGGQKIYLIPSLDAVVVLTGGNYNAARSPATEIMAKELLPALLGRPEAASKIGVP